MIPSRQAENALLSSFNSILVLEYHFLDQPPLRAIRDFFECFEVSVPYTLRKYLMPTCCVC